ncbi:MAG: STAS domain-containing protein [Planctomycetota bacterium]|jgi:anti-anti-sigma regulatory factor
MSDTEPTRQPRAVEIKAEGDMIAAKIIGPVIEANRAQVIVEDVGKAIDDAGTGLRFMVLDFDEVNFVNSTGIGACLELGTRAKAKGALPVLYRLTSDVTEILLRCKVDSIYTIVQTQDELAKVLAD